MPTPSEELLCTSDSKQAKQKLTDMQPLGVDKIHYHELQILFCAHAGTPRPLLHHPLSIQALAHTVRDRLMERWKSTQQAYDQAIKRTHYLHAGISDGGDLGNAMLNLGITDVATQGPVRSQDHSRDC